MKAVYFIILSLFSVLLLRGQVNLDEAVQINSYLGEDLADKRNPKAITNKDGIIAVIWEDERNGLNELYFQLINTGLKRIGANLNLAPGYTVEKNQYDLAALSNGNFVVTWSGAISGRENVYFSIIGPTGQVIIENQLVPKGETISANAYPAVENLWDNTFILGFVEDDFSEPAVRAQRFDYNGQAIGERLLLESLARGDDAENIDIAVNDDKEILFVYQREVGIRDFDIAAVVLDENLKIQGTNLRVNSVEGEAKNPTCVSLLDNDFLIFWLDTREDFTGSVYGQALKASGQKTGRQRKVGTGMGTLITNRYPRALRLGTRIGISNVRSSSIISFVSKELRSPTHDQYEGDLPFPVLVNGEVGAVHLQSILSNFNGGIGAKVILQINEDEYRVNDDQNSVSETVRAYEYSPEGRGIVIWNDLKNGLSSGFAQRIAPDNSLAGDPISVSSGRSSSYTTAIAKDGHFAIYFAEIANFQTTWVINFYAPDGSLIRRKVLGTEDGTAIIGGFQGIEYNPNLNNYVLWSRENESFNSPNSVLRVWTYNLRGDNASDKKTLLSDNAQSIFRWMPRENGDFVISYMDFSKGFSQLDAYWVVVTPNLEIRTGPQRLNTVVGTYSQSSHRLIPGPNNSMYILFQSELENVGNDSLNNPYIIRELDQFDQISGEYYIPAGGNLRGWHYHKDQIRLWKERSDDIYQVKIDPQTFTSSESVAIPEDTKRQNLNFRYHEQGLSVVFQELRTPGKGLDIFSYLIKDAD
ncbi:MAG: hypothetical protein AAF789_11025, partial [Bacteroidota bacterium]